MELLPRSVLRQVIHIAAEEDDLATRNQKLSQLSPVCRSWASIARPRLYQFVRIENETQWSRFHHSLESSEDHPRYVESLCLGGPEETSIEKDSQDKSGMIRQNHHPSAQWLYDAVRILPKRLPNVKTLELGNLPPLHDVFFPLCSRFKLVKTLSLRCITSHSLLDIARTINMFPQIHSLHLDDCELSRPPYIYPIRRPANITDLRFNRVDTDCRRSIVNWLFRPGNLALNLTRLDWCSYEVLGNELDYVLARSPTLRTLSLTMVFPETSFGT